MAMSSSITHHRPLATQRRSAAGAPIAVRMEHFAETSLCDSLRAKQPRAIRDWLPTRRVDVPQISERRSKPELRWAALRVVHVALANDCISSVEVARQARCSSFSPARVGWELVQSVATFKPDCRFARPSDGSAPGAGTPAAMAGRRAKG